MKISFFFGVINACLKWAYINVLMSFMMLFLYGQLLILHFLIFKLIGLNRVGFYSLFLKTPAIGFNLGKGENDLH